MAHSTEFLRGDAYFETSDKKCLNVTTFLYSVTAHVEVHPHAAGTRTTLGQDIDRPSSTSRSAARRNYGYAADDDDDDCEDVVPERHHDWPTAQQTRLDFTGSVPGNDLEEMMAPPSYQNATTADPYRLAPNTNKPLSVISSNLSSSAQTDYNRAGLGVYPADVSLSLNDTDV